MSGSFFVGDDVVFVANRRLASLVEFVLDVAASTPSTPAQQAFVARFEAQARSFFPGIDLDMDETFATAAEKTFWASMFSELSARIELGEIGNPDSADWRSGGALDALRIAEMLRTAGAASALCERIVRARDAGEAIVRIEPAAGVAAAEAAERLGLGGSAADKEISASEAQAILRALLVEDMAYGCAVVAPATADALAGAFIAAFRDSGARYFTNATWVQADAPGRNGNALRMHGWFPATAHTFDSGILVVANDRIGCAWFMDED